MLNSWSSMPMGRTTSELHLGGWAFQVPGAQLAGSGVDQGDSNLRFELMAVVRGLEDTIQADGSWSTEWRNSLQRQPAAARVWQA
jgi:hypothetical protein